MLSYFQRLKHIFDEAIYFLWELAKPNPKYTPDKVLQEVAHNRTKAILAFEIGLITIQILEFFISSTPRAHTFTGILTCLLICIILLISCRWHPEVFKIFYNLLLLSYGPYLATKGPESLHLAWMGIQTYPVFVLLFTGSLVHFLIQAGCQLILLKALYEPTMMRNIANGMLPQDFSQHQSYVSVLSSAVNIVFVLSIHVCLQNAYNKVSVSEKKKEESEKQKTFLLGFSHELRNLINSVMGNVNLASLENPPQKIKEFLLNAEVCGKLLLHLVNNILDTGKVEVGDLEINPTTTNIYHAIENIWSICSELIKRKNLKGKIRIHKNLPRVLNIDHYRLTQIFLNLVGNAVKFTDNGSITISIEWMPHVSSVNDKCFEPKPFNKDSELDEGMFEKHQHFSVFDQNYLVLDLFHKKINTNLLNSPETCTKGIMKVAVSDTGCGILKSDLERLFQKFTQVTLDSSKRKLGTGLGLFITKELCERMNGEIQVFSQKEQGTCFIFCLPINLTPDCNIPYPILSNSIVMKKKLRALVVDDIEFGRLVLKDFFQKLEIEVADTAENGLEAYHKFLSYKTKGEPVDIVTMDLDMPVMNGKEAICKLREFEVRKRLEPCFIVIVSGNCSQTEISECLNQRGSIKADLFLKKPVTISELSSAIHHYLESKASKSIKKLA